MKSTEQHQALSSDWNCVCWGTPVCSDGQVKMLQDARPLARFMYCSATIATDVRHLW